MKETKIFTMTMDEDTRSKLEQIQVETGASLAEIVRRAVASFFDRREKPSGDYKGEGLA